MPVNSTSVRGGIVAMLAPRNAHGTAADVAAGTNGTNESNGLLTKSGYIVVAG